MRKESYYPSGKMIFMDTQRAGSLDSNINENHMVSTITNQHTPQTAQDEYRTSGMANTQKPLQPDVNINSTSENSNIRTRRNAQRSAVHNAPYSEIYNMVVMKITF